MQTEIKPPPHSMEAEQAVIGALLRDNDAIDRIGDLRAEHFFLGDHFTIFSELVAQISAGKACDVISVMVSLGDKVKDCATYLNQMAQNSPSSANIARHSAIVRDKAIKRALVTFGRETSESAINSPEDSAAALDRASSALERIAAVKTRSEPVRARDSMIAYLSGLGDRMDGNGVKAISTGYPDLDKRLSGGLRRGGLYVLAARPKMGKTALALNIACHVSQEYSTLFLSLEMPIEQLNERNVSSLGRIPLDHLLVQGGLNEEDWPNLTFANNKINDLNLYFDEQAGLRLLDVRMKAKLIKRKYGLDLLVIDYLQLMEGDGDNRNAQIEGITRGLKALAKELGIAIILLSQLNRKLEERPNKRPQPSDLRDSGSIEQDADAVIFAYRDEVYNPDSHDRGICEIIIALCRQGAPGTVALAFIGEQVRFESLAHWAPRKPEPKPRRGLAAAL